MKSTIYQIFPDRFYNGNPFNDPQPLRKWKQKPSRGSFFGGDLSGITKKLNYLKHLGIGAIYLTPIFEAPSTHKYDTKDYLKIDSGFGTLEEFKRLLKRAHKFDIKVILDGVFNHTGDHFWAFEDARKNGKKSRYWDWYNIYNYPIKRKPKPNYEHAGIYYIPKLKHDNPEVIAHFVKVVQYWTKIGIDGWRFDMSWCIGPDFWKKITQAALAINKDIIFIGEYWEEPSEFLKKYPFHGATDYIFRKATLQLLNKKIEPKEYLNVIQYKIEDRNTWYCWNMLGSHDTQRLLGQLHGSVERAKMAFTLQFTIPGLPLIYYGDEIGLFGGKDPDCRRPFDWNKKHWKKEIFEHIRELIKLRKERSALSIGDIKILEIEKDGFSFERFTTSESIEIEIDLKLQKAIIRKSQL
ncbi:MAG: glycoside hydrolase family 13 protein [Kosmotoga sp.]|nr:glycoside hydrolase family 13 protein [Kosmotoga sp.]